jgi:hypothetical protein
MTDQETFVIRLRRHRERNRIPLDEIARNTRVKRELLEALEQNDLSTWPRGLYARAYVRSYAEAVGLDPDDTVDEFCRLFPQGDRRAEGTMREIAAIVASESGWRDDLTAHSEIDRRLPAALTVPAAQTRAEMLVSAATRAGRAVKGLFTGWSKPGGTRPATRPAAR